MFDWLTARNKYRYELMEGGGGKGCLTLIVALCGIAFIVASIIMVLSTPARAYSCEQVRWASKLPLSVQRAWIKVNKPTPAQLRWARACLRNKKLI